MSARLLAPLSPAKAEQSKIFIDAARQAVHSAARAAGVTLLREGAGQLGPGEPSVPAPGFQREGPGFRTT